MTEQTSATPSGATDTAAPHLDHRAFEAFGMREVDGETIDAAIAEAGDDLVCVFFWGVDCFNCEMAKKAMLANPEPIRALNVHWLHANVYAHPELGRRFGLPAFRSSCSSTRARSSAARRAGMATASSRPRSATRASRPAANRWRADP
jgi:hypothetical protein